jgi:hypothetical protein
MTYVRVTDLPATWADYQPPCGLGDGALRGLIVFAAGPTDEGIRTVELWTSRAAWLQAQPGPGSAVASVEPNVRELDAPFITPPPEPPESTGPELRPQPCRNGEHS